MTLLIPPVQGALWLTVQQAAARVGGRRAPGPLAAAAGAGLVVCGAGLGVSSLRLFVSRGTTWHPWHPERASSLVTDGPSAWTRNPMYVGIATGLAGTGLASGRPWTALAAAGLLATLTPQVRREEAALASVFGSDWHDYAARTPRWLPRPPRLTRGRADVPRSPAGIPRRSPGAGRRPGRAPSG